MLQGHGDDIYGCEKEIVINFSSNIYSRQDMSALEQFLCTRMHTIHSYPEPDAASLADLLAQKHQVEAANISVTNGATEAVYLIAKVFCRGKSAIIIPTFSEYEDACLINEHKLSYAASLSQIEKDTGLVWLCNPNNPNGSVYHKDVLDKFIQSRPETYFIIDQSYEAFTDKAFTFDVAEALKYENVILLHSMTKSYAIPGLRLGYVTAHDELVRKINKYRMPWSVNQLAIEAGKYLLNGDKLYFDLKAYRAETMRLTAQMSLIEGLVVLPTNTHFFLCELISKKASDLKQYLKDEHGILIRDASNFRGLDEHFFRIATQSPEENDLLVKAIREWI